MRRFLPLALAFLALVLAPAGAPAQAYDLSVGLSGGFVQFGDLADGPAGGLKLDSGPLAGAHVDSWFLGRRVGLRATGSYTQRPLPIGPDERDIETWLASVDVLLRPLPVTGNRTVAPFVSGGIGVVDYGLGTGPVVTLPDYDAVYGGDDETQLAATAGVGFDILLPWRRDFERMGIRLEGVDYIVLESPFRTLDGGDVGPVHNFRISIGLFSTIGELL